MRKRTVKKITANPRRYNSDQRKQAVLWWIDYIVRWKRENPGRIFWFGSGPVRRICRAERVHRKGSASVEYAASLRERGGCPWWWNAYYVLEPRRRREAA